MTIKLNFKKSIISLAGIITSLLVGEMIFANVFPLYTVRFIQLFIILNVIGLGVFNFKLKSSIWVIPYILSAFVFLLHALFFLSSNRIASEIATLFWWSVFVGLLSGVISNREGFLLYRKVVFRSTFIVGLLGGLLGLNKLYRFSIGNPPQWAFRKVNNWGDDVFIVGSSMNYDYNVFSFGLFMVLLIGVRFYKESTKNTDKIFFVVSNFIILFAAMTSSSRRGVIIGSVVLLLLLFAPFLPKIRKKSISFSNFFKKKYMPWFFIVALGGGMVGVSKINLSKIVQSAEIRNLIGRLSSVNSLAEKENTRTIRWEYSMEYFSELSLEKKIIGDGFSYLKDMGREFREEDTDCPHNVWISALLYGGVIGFIITVLTSLCSLVFYIIHYKYLNIFFGWYVLMLLMNFTSSNSIFSSRLFVVLMLLPLLNYKFIKY